MERSVHIKFLSTKGMMLFASFLSLPFLQAQPPAQPMPEKLASFTVLDEGTAHVKLSWSLQNEQGVNHYIVQRSTDGRHFSDIAIVFSMEVAGKGTYSFKDKKNPSTKDIYYYRIGIVNKDKYVSFSAMSKVVYEAAGGPVKINAYPNPIKDQVRVSFPPGWKNKQVMLELYNSSGRKLQSQPLTNTGDTGLISTGHLTGGLYIVRAVCEGEVTQSQVLKN
jgi:hypothetical protein